jgi:hypothetical protein
MQRLLIVVIAGLAALAVYAMYAVAAPTGQQGVSPRRVAALERQVKVLRRDVAVLTTVTARCLLYRASGVRQFGVGDGEGYEYRQANGDAALTTALDLVDPRSSAAELWLLQTTPQCANALNGGSADLAQLAGPAAGG